MAPLDDLSSLDIDASAPPSAPPSAAGEDAPLEDVDELRSVDAEAVAAPGLSRKSQLCPGCNDDGCAPNEPPTRSRGIKSVRRGERQVEHVRCHPAVRTREHGAEARTRSLGAEVKRS